MSLNKEINVYNRSIKKKLVNFQNLTIFCIFDIFSNYKILEIRQFFQFKKLANFQIQILSK